MKDEQGSDGPRAVDVVVVGAGMGGLSASIVAADEGLDVLLVEAGDKDGGAADYS